MPRRTGGLPGQRQFVFYANHSSHLDAAVIWALLPPPLRARTRPVAARDYWTKGASLIIFPEGTRGSGEVIAPFKSGLYHLAKLRPGVPLVPVYLENLNRILPKGEYLLVGSFVTLDQAWAGKTVISSRASINAIPSTASPRSQNPQARSFFMNNSRMGDLTR